MVGLLYERYERNIKEGRLKHIGHEKRADFRKDTFCYTVMV